MSILINRGFGLVLNAFIFKVIPTFLATTEKIGSEASMQTIEKSLWGLNRIFHSSSFWEATEFFFLKLLLFIVLFYVVLKLNRVISLHIPKAFVNFVKDPGVLHFTTSALKMLIYAVFFISFATWFGVPGASILAIIGSAGLAFGLAVQGSLSNFAGGILLLLLRPFKVGDYILEGTKGYEGTVVEMTVVYTKLQTIDNKVVIIPNGSLSNNTMINYSYYDQRKLILLLSISYEADLKKAKEVIMEVLKNSDLVNRTQEMAVYVDNLGDNSVNLGAFVWVERPNYILAKRQLTEDIKLAFDREAISIPYPQITVHYADEKIAK